MSQDHYEFELHASRLDLWLGYAGAIGSVLLAGALIIFAVSRSFTTGALLFVVAIALLCLCGVVVCRALVEAYTVKIGSAGVFCESLRFRRFLPWRDVLQVRFVGSTIRIVFRDGKAFDEAWARLSDPLVRKRIEAFVRNVTKRTGEREVVSLA